MESSSSRFTPVVAESMLDKRSLNAASLSEARDAACRIESRYPIEDSAYLEKRGYVLYTSWEADAPVMNGSQINWQSVNGKDFPYRIVQPAGPKNVLGVVKFLFPNKFPSSIGSTRDCAGPLLV